jgi:hypothetical protein
MIITAHTGQGFGGVLAYVYKEGKKGLSEEEKPIILEQNNLFGTTKQQAQLMRGVAMENSKSSRPVLHLTISYPINEKPTKKEVDEHLKVIIKEIGATAENNQYVIVAHRDSVKDIKNKEEHYHIVINKVGFNGKNINTSYIQNKVHVIADKIEQQFDLKKTIGRKIIYDSEQKQGWRYTTKTERATAVLKAKKEGKKVVVADKRPDIKIAKVAIAEKVKQALLTSTNPQELSSKLAEHGITIGVSVDKENNNAIRGISFKSEEIKVGGKEIGYSWQTINDTFHVNKAKSLEIDNVAPVQTAKEKIAENRIEERNALLARKADSIIKSHVQNIDTTIVQPPRQVPELAKNEEIKEKEPSQSLSAKEILAQKNKSNLDQEIAPGATPTPTPAEQEKAKDLIAKEEWVGKYFEFNNQPESKGLATSLAVEETFKLALEMKASMPKLGYNDMQIADQAIRLSMRNYEYFKSDNGKPIKESSPWGGWDILVGNEKYIELLEQVKKQKQGEIPTLDNSLDLRNKYDVIHLVPRFKKEKTAEEKKREEKRERKEEKKEEKKQTRTKGRGL